MSRGWESKSVEEQQNQAAAPKPVVANNQAEASETKRKRNSLGLQMRTVVMRLRRLLHLPAETHLTEVSLDHPGVDRGPPHRRAHQTNLESFAAGFLRRFGRAIAGAIPRRNVRSGRGKIDD